MHNPKALYFMEHAPHGSPEKDLALQQYMQLSQQQDHLRHRLSLSIPTTSSSTTTSPTHILSPITSLSSSPTHPSNIFHTRTSPVSAHPMPSTSTSSNPDDDKLYEINHQIKATLTELLNNENVKHDDKFRQWVQGRLMDAEQELRRHRRRRSSVDKETVNTIAHSFDHGHTLAYRTSY